MPDQSKPSFLPVKSPNLSVISDTRKSMFCVYVFMLTFILCTFFILFNNPSSSSLKYIANFKDFSHFSSFFSHFFPNSSSNSTFQLGNNYTNYNNINNVSLSSNYTKISPRETVGDELYESMLHCDLFDGKWVKDDSYPLYLPGSCPHIDEPFNCFLNGRPDNTYERYKWQPHGCNIPRLNGTHMLELLRGKRLVYVGDSLNRNMWESLVCILRNSVQNKSRVFEASGREDFRTEGSYAFIFEDYNCSVEFFRSPFLVREWEIPDKNGSKKETLRLDLVERASDRYKDAEFLIFNTGHWWSHEKTSRGEGYYQEGTHVYSQLEVNEAFRRALTTWGRWLEANVDPMKTQVFFRGYSNSHFGGGRWDSGGTCDKETEPIKNMTDLPEQPPMIKVVENVIKWTKVPVFYLNITTLTDYRKDAHPAAYRTEEERRLRLRYQDCAHWCLPGVPDTWNELVYSQILIRNYQKQQMKKQQEQRH
ncbi:protein trichome birefringence [Spinacia oleracea]|uniref:Protein trichome birefringence n=1 Tax=Spinacia oleracea TaxID=3562 RepID=A0A9R0J071_SPIOL|nr:protein trichome birefringence-like [Spinacia oleracea]